MFPFRYWLRCVVFCCFLLDLRNGVPLDHERVPGHVDHRLIELGVGVELVDDGVRTVQFAEPFGLVGVEVEVRDL